MKRDEEHSPDALTEEVISDPRLVAAYLRSAIVERAAVFVKIGELATSGTILDLLEDSARDRETDRSILLFVDRDLGIRGSILGPEFVLTVPLRRMAIQVICRHKSSESKVFTLEVPQSARVIRNRSSHRLIAKNLSPRVCAIQITRSDVNYLGLMEVTDISPNGFGGKISLAGNLEILDGDEIGGQLRQKYGAIPLTGTVVRCRRIDSGSRVVVLVGNQTHKKENRNEK